MLVKKSDNYENNVKYTWKHMFQTNENCWQKTNDSKLIRHVERLFRNMEHIGK